MEIKPSGIVAGLIVFLLATNFVGDTASALVVGLIAALAVNQFRQ